MKIPRTGILMVGFFSVIALSLGNKWEKRELMSNKVVTEKYDKNGDGELEYREKMTFLRSLDEEERNAYRRHFNVYQKLDIRAEYGKRDNDQRSEGIRARLDEAGKKLSELVESGEITKEQARRRMEEMRRRAYESLNGENRDRPQHDHDHEEKHHDDHELGERHHDDLGHGEGHHDDLGHGEKHHDDLGHGERHRDNRNHGEEKHHDDHGHGEKHHDNFKYEINQHFVEIKVKNLLEKFSEISKHLHQLDLERIHLEVDHETAENEPERKEISRQLKRVLLLQDRLQDEGHQTRDKIFHISHGDRENKDETCDDKQEHSFVEKLEDELHHLKQEIQKLNEAGKFDQSEKLDHRAKEIFVEIEQHKNHEEKLWHDEEKFKERVEQILEERRKANVRLEELVNALEQFDDIDEESVDEEREQLEMRIHRIESHVDKLTKELELFDK